MDAFVDPIPVTLDGEVMACLQGRLTYDVYPIDTSGGVELRRRLLYNLPMRTTDVLVEHRCHSEPLPTVLRGPEPISVTPSGDPPF